MTIGQRIAQKRKERGLSQEQLGAELGVSRQAIYKWESDAALPEIEKLVALSRLFAVSVGWLLGEEQAREGGAQEGGDELTEAQLQMVEELVRRYQAAQPKRRRWPVIAACILAAVLVLYLFGQLRGVREEYRRLRQGLNQVQSSVTSQVGTISDQVRSLLEQQASITLSAGVEITDVDCAGGTVTFSCSAAPKTYVNGMTAVFIADYGTGTAETAGMPGADQSYTAALTCPLTDAISVLVAFVQGDTRQYQIVAQYDGLYSQSFPQYDLNCPLWFAVTDSGVLSAQERFDVVNWDSGDTICPARASAVRMGLFRDQKLVLWLEQTAPDSETPAADTRSFCVPRSIELEKGHTYCLALVVTDVYGREHVTPDAPVQYVESRQSWDLLESWNYSADPADWIY